MTDFTYFVSRKALDKSIVAQLKTEVDVELSVPKDAITHVKTHLTSKK